MLKVEPLAVRPPASRDKSLRSTPPRGKLKAERAAAGPYSLAAVSATTPHRQSRTKDTAGGLPSVAELSEARKPKDAAKIAKVAGRLTLFQRSPNWIVPRMNRPYTDEEKAQFRAQPELMEKVRNEIFQMAEERLIAKRNGTAPVEEVPIPLAHLHAQVADPELRAKLTPDYEIGCKRVLISNDFYPALTRPNVELVTDAIARLTPQGVVDASGRLHEADVVICATGFETKSFAGETAISGQGGLTLAQAWKAGPEAYLGITVAGFPNLFMLYGPNTNLGHNSIIYMIEAQVGYVLQALAQERPLSVSPAVQSAYNDKLQAELAHTPWAGTCTSWYKTPEGKILNNWPASAQAYAEAVARFDAGAYRDARAAEPAE